MMQQDAVSFALGFLERGEPAMLIIVAESTGFSPGRAGFKMSVTADGSVCGTVGGGTAESVCIEEARRMLRARAESPPFSWTSPTARNPVSLRE